MSVLCNNTAIKKLKISSQKLFITSKPSGLVLFLLEYNVHVKKTLRGNNHINVFDKGNLIEGSDSRHYPLATFILQGYDEDCPITFDNRMDVFIHDKTSVDKESPLLLSL